MKTFKWTVELEVSENWVEDGFNLTDESAKEMLASFLPYAYGYELNAVVIKAPSEKSIKKARGVTVSITDED